MALLSRYCGSHEISDQEFRVLFALLIEFLDNRSDWCRPCDAKLGAACAKSERTVRRITAKLKHAGHIEKRKRLGASQYSFTALAERKQDRPTLAGNTCQLWSHVRPTDGRTEPSYHPSDEKPSDRDGSAASPSPPDEALAASHNVGANQQTHECVESPKGHSERDWGEASNQNSLPAELLTESAAKRAVDGYIAADQFARKFPPSQRFYVEAVQAELRERGSGRAVILRGANENWKAQFRRSA
jgi:hypothetical protein